jgi:glycosyltransferase involved in cell wall biosynthesis
MGGAQRQLVLLALGFKKRGHEVSFLTYHDIPFFEPELRRNHIDLECVSSKNYLRRLQSMRFHIRNGGYDAVISFLESANFICEIAGLPSRRWKLIVGERSSNPSIRKSVRLSLYRWFHFFADHVVANSNSNIELIRSINPFLTISKCSVIYNIVDFQAVDYGNELGKADHEPLNIVVTARPTYEKNLLGLVEAIQLLDDTQKKRLMINWYGFDSAGNLDGSVKEALEIIKVNDLAEIIRFHPPTKDIPEVISNADAVGLFSLYEGLPNTVCEGMASARPIVCSAVSDIPELLGHEPGLLFNPNDPHSIRDALRYLISLKKDQLLKIGEENREVAVKHFGEERIVRQYLDLMI